MQLELPPYKHGTSTSSSMDFPIYISRASIMASKEEEEEEEEDHLMQLFDLYWFKHQILTNQTTSKETPKPKLSYSDLHMRSFSYNSLSSKDIIRFNRAHTPNSVLSMLMFESILSGKDSEEGLDGEEKQGNDHGFRMSKSISELEFEELKGFMDLGFEFSEEDKRSPRLVSILPGLKRLGKNSFKGNEDDDDGGEERVVSRPYLSEAWWEGGNPYPPFLLMMMMKNWRLPSLRNEDDMKNRIRMWARAVALLAYDVR